MIHECLQLLMEVFMKVMHGLVMTLQEDKIVICLAALLYEQFCQFTNEVMKVQRYPLMSRTIERTQFMWEKGRGDKCCPGPESCLPCARPVLGASVSEWHIRPWDGCHGAQRQGGVYLCQAPGGMVARGSGCAHRFSPKLGNPGIASVWD